MKTEQPILITTVEANADLSSAKNKFISVSGILSSMDDIPLGVLAANTDLGEQAPVIAAGIALVYTAASILQGAQVQCDDNGLVSSKSSGDMVGIALDAASGANELIRVLLK